MIKNEISNTIWDIIAWIIIIIVATMLIKAILYIGVIHVIVGLIFIIACIGFILEKN